MIDFKELERFSKDMTRGFRPHVFEQVNRSEVDLLMVVERFPNHAFRHYAKMIHLEKSSFSYVVDILVLKGLVEKVEDANDKRRKSLVITEKGGTLIKQLIKQRNEYIETRLDILSEEERRELEKAIEVISRIGTKMRESFPMNRRGNRPDFEPRHDLPKVGEFRHDGKRRMKEGHHPGKRSSSRKV